MLNKLTLNQLIDKQNFIIITDNNNLMPVIRFFSSVDHIINYKVYTVDQVADDLLVKYRDDIIYQGIKKDFNKYFLKSCLNDLNIALNLEKYPETKEELLKDFNTKLKDFEIKPNINLNLKKYQGFIIYDLVEIKDLKYDLVMNKLKSLNCSLEELPLLNDVKNFPFVICSSPKEEVKYVINDICKQLKQKQEQLHDVSNITIAYTLQDYKPILKMYLDMYNLPYSFKEKKRVFELDLVKVMYNQLDKEKGNVDSFKALAMILQSTLKKDDIVLIDKDAYNAIINLFNKWIGFKYDDIAIDLFKDDLFNLTYANKVNEGITLTDDITKVTDIDILYVIGAINDSLPKVYKERGLFSLDDLKTLTSYDLVKQNEASFNALLNTLTQTNYLLMTCPLNVNGYDMVKSSISSYGDEINYSEDLSEYFSKPCAIYDYASAYDEHKLYANNPKLLQIYYKYFKDCGYKSFANEEFKLDDEALKYLKNDQKIRNLSYSSLDNFFNCPFKFYLHKYFNDQEPFNENFFIGNLFHYVLEQLMLNVNSNYEIKDNLDEEINNYTLDYLNTLDTSLTKVQLFYLKIYKEYIKGSYIFLINFLKQSSFDVYQLEKTYEIDLTVDGKDFKINGKIDLTLKYKEKQDYVVVIDYKTGKDDVYPEFYGYGYNLQLPVYIMLIKDANKSVEVIGAFLKNVFDKSLSQSALKKKSRKFKGLSNNTHNIMSELHPDYPNYIDTTNALSSADLAKIGDVAKNCISKAIEDILNGKFDIAPKTFGQNNSCQYCQYHDICHHHESDITKLEPDKQFSYLRGEEDA